MKHHTRTTLAAALLLLLLGFTAPAFSFDFLIPDTGQDLCYDWNKILCDEWHMSGPNQVCDSEPYCPLPGEDFYGQDAQYTINPPDLTDNGNGTITDNLTGLIWEQKTAAEEVRTCTFNEAVDYCETSTLGGFDDWRLPTRWEYVTLLNYGRVSPALDVSLFPFYTSDTTNAVYYWTSSELHGDSSKVWKILISFGLIESGPKEGTLHKVRCVRGAATPQSTYTDNGDGTVTDNLTGLMWEQKTNDGGKRDKNLTYTWKDALAYCETLVHAGFSDWRLPNTKELERVVDLNASNPAIDTEYFANTSNGKYWTSTTCTKCHQRKAFTIDFSSGELYYGNKLKDDVYFENYVRCVRTAEDIPDTTTTTAASTTTTSAPVTPCVVEELYGGASVQAALLRNFRDRVLNETTEGRALIELYYRWSPLIAQAVREDDQLRKEIKEMVGTMINLTTAR
jgi:hypothetical protein